MPISPDSIQISALQHYQYCPRQCALIHIENIWTENQYTAEGRILHERADSGGKERRGNLKTCRSVHIYSEKLGIHGIADVVEYHREKTLWQPHPVEYKRGKPKKTPEDRIQLCAQALCLEEMHETSIPNGDLYYGTTKRRVQVPLDEHLRELTLSTIHDLRQMLISGITPPADFSPRCEKCSIADNCLPKAQRLTKGINAWNDRFFQNMLTDDPTL